LELRQDYEKKKKISVFTMIMLPLLPLLLWSMLKAFSLGGYGACLPFELYDKWVEISGWHEEGMGVRIVA